MRLYMDMGARVERDMTRLLDGYEYIFYVWDWGLDTSIFGARKGDFLIMADLNFIHTLYKSPMRKHSGKKGIIPPLVQLSLTGCKHSRSCSIPMLYLHPEEIEGLDRAEKWQIESNTFVSLVQGSSWNGREDPKNNKSIFDSKLDLFSVRPS